MSSWVTRVLDDGNESLEAQVRRMWGLPTGTRPPTRYVARTTSAKELMEREREIRDIEDLSDWLVQRTIRLEAENNRADYERRLDEMIARGKRYVSRLVEIDAWQPPPAFLRFKQRLFEQMAEACNIEISPVVPPSDPHSVSSWRAYEATWRRQSLEDTLRRDDEAREVADQRTHALRDLYDSLGVEYSDEPIPN